MQKIIYETEKGVSIVIPAPKNQMEKLTGPLTNEEYENLVMQKSIHDKNITNYEFINEADIPKSREFRNAWILKDKKVDFDLNKAKDIQLERIRSKREEKLKELDYKINEAILLDNSESKTKLAKERQELLDITESLKAMSPGSIDDIKNAFPESLK